ncbi:uncharacterized protein LAESUDRAFT_169104 [Laetiporus sulphureus 93-53]|uniref:Uncharacterized protein n=1 Tax=Laetiporus sulphureus 93-53 TaxID=1314785 RepID=A0A165HT75_9APHY|nr:uncharacterized protein LAESUDRAFT_169104 [Laetiporus sulphureus 93-53]KZT12157.1 hypothetical protein LAESUDRAFT_169104 [Laetiporus sulphureus 93-53]
MLLALRHPQHVWDRLSVTRYLNRRFRMTLHREQVCHSAECVPRFARLWRGIDPRPSSTPFSFLVFVRPSSSSSVRRHVTLSTIYRSPHAVSRLAVCPAHILLSVCIAVVSPACLSCLDHPLVCPKGILLFALTYSLHANYHQLPMVLPMVLAYNTVAPLSSNMLPLWNLHSLPASRFMSQVLLRILRLHPPRKLCHW